MSEQGRKWLVGLVAALAFIICMVLVIVGQRRIELMGLVMQLIGLIGILVLLFLYNRKYK